MRAGAGTSRVLFAASFTLLFGFRSANAEAQTLPQLQQLSIDELANLDITSVTKTTEPLSNAPASVYVITHDDIVRSGAPNIPEILRLAPNLQVQQVSASRYIVTARGFSGNIPDQSFTNKLLVLIDGRSVYTPLFSGVFWDMQDVVPEDIDHIEVISGPGATLWGANAVNGVINIVTRKSGDTQGVLADIRGGNLAQTLTARFGGAIKDGLTYRFYFRDYIGNNMETAAKTAANDHWSRPQGGFRVDWASSAADLLTFQGDIFRASEAQGGPGPHEIAEGNNLTARWTHSSVDGSSLQVQAYYDRIRRADAASSGDFWQNTYDIDLQHSFTLYDWNQITWGGGYRAVDYRIDGTPTLFFIPPARTLSLANIFLQDSISLAPSVKLILGLKAEDDPFSHWTALPSARLSWKASDKTLLWTAISRAIRSPTPFETDVVEKIGSTVFLAGNRDFRAEELTAYEAGLRMQPSADASFSLSAFYNDYDKLRTVEPGNPNPIPLSWGNLLAGHTYGFELWGNYQLTRWWRLSASVTELAEDFHFKPGSAGLLGVAQIGDDPERRVSLRSSMDIGSDVTVDAELRYVSALPDPALPSFVELNTNIGWNVTDKIRLSISGFNLLHARHFELPPSEANAVPRSFMAGLQWRY